MVWCLWAEFVDKKNNLMTTHMSHDVADAKKVR
jgi:hypothetical protein